MNPIEKMNKLLIYLKKKYKVNQNIHLTIMKLFYSKEE